MTGSRRSALAPGVALALAFAASVAACDTSTGLVSPPASATGPSTAAPSASGAAASPSAAAGSPSPSIPASPLVGLVTKVDSAGLDKVSGFTLRTDAGQTLAFTIGILENGAQFPPGHLAEHLATAAPVRVWFREDGGKLVVYRIEDAG